MKDTCKLFSPACRLDASKILLQSCRDLQVASSNLDAMLCKHLLNNNLGMQVACGFASKPLIVDYVMKNQCVRDTNPSLYTAMSTVSQMSSKLKALFAGFLG